MHEFDVTIGNEITLYKQGYIPEEVYRKLHRDGYVAPKINVDVYNDYNRALDELYFDAFEGDSDAYWNID